MYYIKCKPNFSEKKKVYKTLTNKYKNVGSLEFKLEDGIKKVFVFRPLRQKEFRPLGDIIIGLDEIPSSQIFNGEIPINKLKTLNIN
mgnify:CR=1 FL=1